MSAEDDLWPLSVFRFRVDFYLDPFTGSQSDNVPLCSGSFSECTGLDATMEPKVIKEGGRNYGANQRVGPVSFGTVILKRGMTRTRDLYNWFSTVAGGGYSYRLSVEITMQEASATADSYDEELSGYEVTDVLTVRLDKALPVKFRSADLNAASGTTVAIEELHLVHEGLTMVSDA